MLGGVSVSSESVNAWGRFVYYATLITGGAGLVLGAIGSVCLLIKRRMDENLGPYTKRKDYFNLLFILAVFLTGILSWALVDHNFDAARGYLWHLVTFSPAESIEPVTVTHIVLLLLLAIYMPFTNMMHFLAKWFTYHKVRWDDVPNLRGSNLERSLEFVHSQPLSWSSPHTIFIKHWHDIAQKTSEEEHAPRVRKG